jgi:hypothetical protein
MGMDGYDDEKKQTLSVVFVVCLIIALGQGII